MRQLLILLILASLLTPAFAGSHFFGGKKYSDGAKGLVCHAKTASVVIISSDSFRQRSNRFVLESEMKKWNRMTLVAPKNEETLTPVSFEEAMHGSDLVILLHEEPMAVGHPGGVTTVPKYTLSVYEGIYFRSHTDAALGQPPLWTDSVYGENHLQSLIHKMQEEISAERARHP